MQASQDLVLKLVGLVYDAGADPSRWPAFLTLLADSTRGASAAMYTDLSFRSSSVWSIVRIDPAAVKAYQEHYVTLNDLTPLRLTSLEEGGVATRRAWCSDGEMLRKEYYNDFLGPQGMFHSLTGLIFRRETSTTNIDVFRPYGAEAFDHEEVELLRTLMPHLKRSLEIHRRIAALEQQQKATEAAIDLVPIGVVLQGLLGTVSVNVAARVILAQRDGLRLGPHGLEAVRWSENQRLQLLIAQACETSRGKGLSAGGSMSVSRPSMLRDFAVMVCPMPPGESVFGGCPGHAAVFITDPEAQVETVEEVTRRAFALTAGEATMAALLVKGKTVKEISDELHISVATARTHLKHIFAKTGTHRQSDLVRLLVMSPATLHRHDVEPSPIVPPGRPLSA